MLYVHIVKQSILRHTVFVCPRWHTERQLFELDYGKKLHSNKIINEMISFERKWKRIQIWKLGKERRE